MGAPSRAGHLLAGLLLLAALVPCSAGTWLPFRPTEGTCNDLQLTFRLPAGVNYNPTANDCQKEIGADWAYVGAQAWSPGSDPSVVPWAITCRRCGLPKDAILMWFRRATSCWGECPFGWVTLTAGVHPSTAAAVDASPADPYTSSPNFGDRCLMPSDGKVLCALGGRPASAQCKYTWRGTAPVCLDACEPGETLLAKDQWGEGAWCLSGTSNKMFCERCQTELYNLNDCAAPTWYGTAPTCQGECNVGDRVMARATKERDVPADQDPGGFGKKCLNDGWKVRCQECKLRNLLGAGPRIPPFSNTTCSNPKARVVWKGTPYITLSGIKTYDRCCRECYDAPACRRFHVGPTGCFLFPTSGGTLAAVPKQQGRAGGGVWQAGSRQV